MQKIISALSSLSPFARWQWAGIVLAFVSGVPLRFLSVIILGGATRHSSSDAKDFIVIGIVWLVYAGMDAGLWAWGWCLKERGMNRAYTALRVPAFIDALLMIIITIALLF